MKKIDRLILKSFLGPLLLTFAIAIFVLLMQFLWKYIDDMVGKGLEFYIIAKLLFYASATFVPMALPIAVLFASIMTMGNFGEKYELVAMKAGGISIRRIMMPMAVVAVILTGIAFYFSNNVMPVAMMNYKTMLYDVTRKKPAINIRPSEYYNEIDGYVIRANTKKSDGTMEDIIVYDHTRGANQTNVVVAESGFLEISPDNRYMVFNLMNGYNYLEDASNEKIVSRPFTSIAFDTQLISFDISSFAFDTSSTEFFSNGYQMQNVHQLDSSVNSLNNLLEGRYDEYAMTSQERMRCYALYKQSRHHPKVAKNRPTGSALIKDADKNNIYQQALFLAQQEVGNIDNYAKIVNSEKEWINRHHIEWQRKYTLSIACLLLFLIGAPFGSIVRKGGLGLPLVASVIFFVLYYVIGMIAEKSVREGAMGPIGMWVATFVFLPIGILLTLQATTDSSFFDAATWKKMFKKIFGRHSSNAANIVHTDD